MLDQGAEFFSFDIIVNQKEIFTLSCNFVNSEASAHVILIHKRAHRDKRTGVESVVHRQRINSSYTTTLYYEWPLSVEGLEGVDVNESKPRK